MLMPMMEWSGHSLKVNWFLLATKRVCLHLVEVCQKTYRTSFSTPLISPLQWSSSSFLELWGQVWMDCSPQEALDSLVKRISWLTEFLQTQIEGFASAIPLRLSFKHPLLLRQPSISFDLSLVESAHLRPQTKTSGSCFLLQCPHL